MTGSHASALIFPQTALVMTRTIRIRGAVLHGTVLAVSVVPRCVHVVIVAAGTDRDTIARENHGRIRWTVARFIRTDRGACNIAKTMSNNISNIVIDL